VEPAEEAPRKALIWDRVMNLRLLKWLGIVGPLSFLVLADVLRHTVFGGQFYVFPGVLGLIVTYVFLTVSVVVFSFALFGFISRLQRRVTLQNRQLTALNRIAATATGNLQLHDTLGTALEQVLVVMEADVGLICTVDGERQEHSAVCFRGFSGDMVGRRQRVGLPDDPVAEQVVRTGQPVVIERVLEDPRVAEAGFREGIRSAVSAPLKSEGEVVGILVVGNRQERRFSSEDRQFLDGVGDQLGIVIRDARLYEESLRQNLDLGALVAVGKAVTSSTDLDAALDRALDTILEATSAEAAEVWLAEGDRHLAMRRFRGSHEAALLERTRFPFGEGYPGIVAQTREPLIVHDLAEDPRFLRSAAVAAGIQTFRALPLLHQDGGVDVLAVAARSPDALKGPAEMRLLEGVGEWVAVAVENARLREQVGNIAVLEERERIAQELHDGLAQVLLYINAQTSAIGRLLSDGRAEEARGEILQLREAARGVYADVREAILGLHLASAQPGRIWRTLREYAENIATQTAIRVTWVGLDIAERSRVEPATETQLMRIVQEALTNVRKHAAASEVTVSIADKDGCLSIAVEDNGRGFDPATVGQDGNGRFGLHTMRERARGIGGRLQVASAPGAGTTVIVNVPHPGAEEARHGSP
jgi:signal transduction histidine kinase